MSLYRIVKLQRFGLLSLLMHSGSQNATWLQNRFTYRKKAFWVWLDNLSIKSYDCAKNSQGSAEILVAVCEDWSVWSESGILWTSDQIRSDLLFAKS